MTMQPTASEVLVKISGSMGGRIPWAIELAADGLPEMVIEQARSSAFAMPPENGALSEETRTLIYFAVALATGSDACIEAMLNKSEVLGVPAEALAEAFKIARYAEATRVVGNAEKLFERLGKTNPAGG